MEGTRKTDKDVIQDGRKAPLKDVEVSLKDRIIDKLVKKLEDLGEDLRTVEIWNQGNADRQEWLDRQHKLLAEYDEFIDPIYTATEDWSSTLHLPIALTVAKTYHARMNAALLGIDPPFTVKARQGANQDRSVYIQELMRYILKDYINNYQGMEEVVDRWLWNWVTRGSAIMKGRWERKYSRYIDVVKEPQPSATYSMPDPATGEMRVVQDFQLKEVEKEVQTLCFDGPMAEDIPTEDVLIVGGEGDPQNADEVHHRRYYTAGELWTLVDQKVFRKEIVEEIIEGGEQLQSASTVNGIKQSQAQNAGTNSPDKNYDALRYEIIERHAHIDVNGSGIPAELILWVHTGTKKLLRATYLRRVMPTGLRPFFKIDFHKRVGQDYGVGIIELLFSLTKEIDAIHNMKVDFGLISSVPFGFYRPSASITEDRLPVEPGTLIPLDNPQTDVFFPQIGNKSFFTSQEEQFLMSQVERFTSVSDISLGVIGGQGASRTATGTRALLGESNANLDIFLRRMNRGWKRFLVYIFHMCQEKLPAGFQFRVTGDDGNTYWSQVPDKAVLEGMFDFELEGNSANSNKSIQIEQANTVVATIMNPLLIQLGMVSPLNIYEALRLKFMTEGVRDWQRYISKPQGQMRIYTPLELADATLAGVDIPFGPEQDLQGFVDLFNHILEHDELLGQYTEEQTISLAKKAQQAQSMMQAVQAQQAQLANQQQVQTNAAMTTGQTAAQPTQPVATQMGSAQ